MGHQLAAARHNFTSLPRVRSERPAFELHHPDMVERMRSEARPNRKWEPLAAAESSTHVGIPDHGDQPKE